MDRLHSMRVFRCVVDEGGFAAAARRLETDPAMVTRLVSDLEKHLGTRLLQRTTRRLALTPAGEDYLARLRLILADIDEADASVQGHIKELVGRVRILAAPVVATHVLGPAIASFHDRYPDIHLDIRVLDLADPPIEEYDLTFQSATSPRPADIVVREVTRSHSFLFAAPAYLEKFGEPRTPQDLVSHRLLRLRTAGGRVNPLRLFDPVADGLEERVDVAPVLLADHTDTLLRATLEAAGISGQSQDIASPYFNAGQLRRVVAPWITNRLSLVAAFPSQKFLPARARVFLEHVIEHVNAGLSQTRTGTRPNTEPRRAEGRRYP